MAGGPRGDRGDRVTQKILMIEDNAPLAAMVSEYLANAGYTVTTCETASLGLERLESPIELLDAAYGPGG